MSRYTSLSSSLSLSLFSLRLSLLFSISHVHRVLWVHRLSLTAPAAARFSWYFQVGVPQMACSWSSWPHWDNWVTPQVRRWGWDSVRAVVVVVVVVLPWASAATSGFRLLQLKVGFGSGQMIDGWATNLKTPQRDGDVHGRAEAEPNLRLCVQKRFIWRNEAVLNRALVSVYRDERGGNFHGKYRV